MRFLSDSSWWTIVLKICIIICYIVYTLIDFLLNHTSSKFVIAIIFLPWLGQSMYFNIQIKEFCRSYEPQVTIRLFCSHCDNFEAVVLVDCFTPAHIWEKELVWRSAALSTFVVAEFWPRFHEEDEKEAQRKQHLVSFWLTEASAVREFLTICDRRSNLFVIIWSKSNRGIYMILSL